jgi:small-conductance mechanosensitive channel
MVGAVVGAGLAGLLIEWVLCRLPGRLGRYAAEFRRTCHAPFVVTLMVFTALIVWRSVQDEAQGFAGSIDRLLVILAIASSAWLGVRGLDLVERFAMTRLRIDVDDNRRVRQLRTQVTVLKRVVAAGVVIVAVATILMSFDELRAFGTSLLASAGLAGVIAGLAAQTTLSNVFAGLQLAFTDAVRIDDVVVVEGEWGWIEELTLTYVVVHVWDERRLVLPTTYFTSTPFQNWTRRDARVLGAVLLHLDYATPLDALRRRTLEALEANPKWDGQAWVLQVVDTTEKTMVVRVLATSVDAPTSWDLRCDLREALLRWLQEEHPDSLPRVRADLDGAHLGGAHLDGADPDRADIDATGASDVAR